VCVGIGPTKTLAKLANHAAKKRLAGQDGVCDFLSMQPGELTRLLAGIPVGQVWGIGRKYTVRLEEMGITTALQLRESDAETIRARFSVVVERTVQELRGVSCLELEEVVPDKQQIMCSRSFGTLVYERAELEEVVASYIGRAAQKLRAQDALAGALQVYVQTNIFKPEAPQYQKGLTVPLPEATSDTRVLTAWALRILRRIYRPGYGYHKAGVMLVDITPKGSQQFSLFAPSGVASARSGKLMEALDGINQRYGRGTLRVAAEGVEKGWQMRRGNLSPRYTTDWAGLPTVSAS